MTDLGSKLRRIVVVLAFLLSALGCTGQNADFEKLREKMVDVQIMKRRVVHQATLEAIRRVERHLFVPPEYRGEAYSDRPLPIGYGQTISQPYIVAFMTAALEPKPGDRILEIGTGSGYQAAVLAEIVDTVYTIEIVEALCDRTKVLLDTLGYRNIKTKCGDGYRGWPGNAPFDGIIVTAAPVRVPQPLIDQLKRGGKMVIPVGSQDGIQKLQLLEKTGKGKVKTSFLLPVRFVPMTRNGK